MANKDFSQLLSEMKTFAGSIQAYLTEFYVVKVAEATQRDESAADTMKIVQEFMLRRGKCVQSFIAWNAYKLAGGTNDDAMIRIGGAIEANHYFLLNIDDMADHDTLRHGGPTVELMFREMYPQIPSSQRNHYARSFSEIASSLIYSHVYEMLIQSNFPPEKILTAMQIVVDKMLHSPATGWQIHILQNFDKLKDSDEERFIKALTYVTSHYKFVGPSLIGLSFADADQSYKDALTIYGENVGTAFQVYDDVLGLFGDPKVTGKSAGNDVREGKKTLLLQYAYKKAGSKDKEFLDSVVGTNLSEDNVERVRQIVRDTGSLEYSQQKAQTMVEAGVAALQPLRNTSNAQYIDNLEQLAQFVIARDK